MEIAAEIISDQTLLEKAAYYIKNIQGKVSLSVLPKIYHVFIQMCFILFLIFHLENYCTLSNFFFLFFFYRTQNINIPHMTSSLRASSLAFEPYKL